MKNFKPISILILFAFVSFIGCYGPKHDLEAVKAANDTNIKKVAGLYRLYSAWSSYKGPKSKEQLIDFVRTNDSVQKNLDLMGVEKDKIEEYFISENDGEEFEFRWGAFVNPDLARCREPIVFEKTGKDGVRLVILSNRKILEVRDEKKYKSLLKGKVSNEDAKTDTEKDEDAAEAE